MILADEPTGNLDSKHGQEVTMILHDIVRDENRSVLIVTHDPSHRPPCSATPRGHIRTGDRVIYTSCYWQIGQHMFTPGPPAFG